ncbi:hypothetical protein [Novipirellula artificiosorum]|uniref:Uncharacterized protein n=1 Tax=Novipirellula artificiosorum TaxID=2528016 RepID=A0A5C6CU51_9BACT|nr:hypothetical protein [Novipirellula artificiosorum]TWU27948.1 hypothetical protein Poly41_70220 [Novipirellula artificiosorum]
MSTVNPYESPTVETPTVGRGTSFILRPAFAATWILAWCFLALGLIAIVHLNWPIPRIDQTFYFRLYASIGAVAGLLSWFSARLVALDRLALSTLAILLLPLGFVFALACELNPPVAGLTAIIAGSTLVLARVARGDTPIYSESDDKADEP